MRDSQDSQLTNSRNHLFNVLLTVWELTLKLFTLRSNNLELWDRCDGQMDGHREGETGINLEWLTPLKMQLVSFLSNPSRVWDGPFKLFLNNSNIWSAIEQKNLHQRNGWLFDWVIFLGMECCHRCAQRWFGNYCQSGEMWGLGLTGCLKQCTVSHSGSDSGLITPCHKSSVQSIVEYHFSLSFCSMCTVDCISDSSQQY